MEETRTIKVLPSQVNAKSELWHNFGWTLISSQEINNTESHLEKKIDGIYNVTTKENYVNLVFKRDTNMPNYEKLVDLEKEYYDIPENAFPKKETLQKLGVSALGLMSVIFGFMYFLDDLAFLIPMVVIGIGLIPLGIFLVKSGNKKYNEAMAQNQKNNSDSIRNEARSLL